MAQLRADLAQLKTTQGGKGGNPWASYLHLQRSWSPGLALTFSTALTQAELQSKGAEEHGKLKCSKSPGHLI